MRAITYLWYLHHLEVVVASWQDLQTVEGIECITTCLEHRQAEMDLPCYFGLLSPAEAHQSASTSSSSEVYSNSCPGAYGARTRAIACEVCVIWFHGAMERLPFLWYHVCSLESSGAVRSP